jgi:tetratricopeptide (TPR) repeat protein
MSLRAKVVLFIVLVAFSVNGFSQTAEKDSLVNLLPRVKGDEKLKILYKLSDITSDSEEAIKYADEAIGVAKKINENALVDAYDNLGFVYYNQNNDEKALDNFNKSLALSQKIGYHKGSLNALNRLMQIYFYIDSLDKSKSFANRLLKKAEEVDSFSVSGIGIVADWDDSQNNRGNRFGSILY